VLKILFNIFLIYLIWQGIKLFISMNKVQSNLNKKVNDMNEKMNQSQRKSKKKDSKSIDEEYIDYEEIKD
jgi:predicted tellurium resistance membrane protein TerC